MNGNTLEEFIDDLLTMGGPEKEFVYKDKRYSLQTLYNEEKGKLELSIDKIYKDQSFESYIYEGDSFQECLMKFEKDPIFDGLTLYEAEKEITVVFG